MSQNSSQSLQEQIQALYQQLDTVSQSLHTQNQILRRRGMNLNGTLVRDLNAFQQSGTNLSKHVSILDKELIQLRALARTTALINSSQNTDEVLNQVIDTVIELTGAERGYIVLANKETGELEFRVAQGMDRELLEQDGEFIISKTIVSRVAETGEAQLTDNAIQDARFQSADSVIGLSLRSILAVPMIIRENEVMGVVYCDNRVVSGLFRREELDLLKAFANQAAVAIENAQLFESARKQLAQVIEIRDFMDSIFTSITGGVITLDRNNIIIIANDAARNILNTQQAEGSLLHMILPDAGVEFYAAIDDVLSTESQKKLDIEPEVSGLGKRYWNVIASPLKDMHNAVQGVVIVVDDLTEQKRREQQFAELQRYLPTALLDAVSTADELDTYGQERYVSALFADVRGFTTFSELLEPEDVLKTINKYLSVASDAIDKYEGVVDQYLGDAVIGIFNTQLNPQAEHPLRAVQAAMEIVEQIDVLHQTLPPEQQLHFSIGIHSATSVVGNVGGTTRKEFSVMGEAPDICKFLQEQAKPGEVIISPQTYAAVKTYFECQAIPIPKISEAYEHISEIYRVIGER